MPELNDRYLEFAELLSELSTLELKMHNMRRIIDEIRGELSGSESDGGYGTDLSAHAFKQISERLERLAFENIVIYNDVFKAEKSETLLLPSNLKSFVITLIADARKKGNFSREKSKNTPDGTEFRYTIEIQKWSDDKTLQFVCIVENNNVKTGYFNWV